MRASSTWVGFGFEVGVGVGSVLVSVLGCGFARARPRSRPAGPRVSRARGPPACIGTGRNEQPKLRRRVAHHTRTKVTLHTERGGPPHGGRVARHTAGKPGLAAFHWALRRGGTTARSHPGWRGGSRDAGRIAPPDGPRPTPVPGGRGGPSLAGCQNGALLSARSAASPSANMPVRSPKRSKGA